MLDLDRVRGHVPFQRDGWQRTAFWAAVLAAGIALGVRWAHPELDLVALLNIRTAPTAGIAESVAGGLTLLALVLLTAIIGTDKLIEP